MILCGQADFHHIADVAKSQVDLAKYLTEPIRARPYDKYIYWYFGVQCLSTVEPDLAARFLAKICAHGHEI